MQGKNIWLLLGMVCIAATIGWGDDFVWTGAEDGLWRNPGNWNPNGIPGAATPGDTAQITAQGNNPYLDSDIIQISKIIIDSDAVLDLNGYSIYTIFDDLINNGTIQAQGHESLASITEIEGTVEFYDTGTDMLGITHFTNIIIRDGRREFAGNPSTQLLIDGYLTIRNDEDINEKGELILYDSSSAIVGGDVTLTGGNLSLGPSAIFTVKGNMLAVSGNNDTILELNSSAELTVWGEWSATPESTNFWDDSTVTLTGETGSVIITNDNEFGKLEISGAYTVTGDLLAATSIEITGNISFEDFLSITTPELTLGADITGTGNNDNLFLQVDDFDFFNSPSSNHVDVGATGIIQITPYTRDSTIEYSPNNSSIADVWYSSAWNNVTAGNFIIGDDDGHQGNITVSNISGATYPLTVSNSAGTGTNGTITILNNYSSQNRMLTLNAGAGGVVLDGGGGAAAINLGDGTGAPFIVTGIFKLKDLTTGTITAIGDSGAYQGISLGGGIAVQGNGDKDLTLNAGNMNITITGNVGTNAAPVGTMSINTTGTSTTLFKNVDINTTNTQYYNGIFTFKGNALTLESSLTVTGLVTITNSGVFTSTAAISSAGGFVQNGSGENSKNEIGAGITTINKVLSFAAPVELTGNVTFLTFNETENTGETGDITFTKALTRDNTARTITLNAGMGDVSTASIGISAAPLGAISIKGNDITMSGLVISGGLTTITNSGVFTSTAAISSAGGFAQNGSGENSKNEIGAGITTINKVLSFAAPVELTGDVTFLTFNETENTGETGDITFTKALTRDNTARTITLNAGMGDVSTASIGTNDYMFKTIEITCDEITISGNVYTDETITIDNNNTLTLETSGGLYAQGLLRINGDTVNSGTIQAGPVTLGMAVSFGGDYANSTAVPYGKLLGNSSTDPIIEFQGDVSFGPSGSFDHDGDTIQFTGDKEQEFNSGTNPVGTVVINKTDKSVKLITNHVAQRAGNLIIEQGILDLDDQGWIIDYGSTPPSPGFIGNDGDLVFGKDQNNYTAELHTGDFIIENECSIEGSGTANIVAGGKVDVDWSNFSGDLPSVTITMTGSGETITTHDKQIGNLTVSKTGDIILKSDLVLTGNMTIEEGGSLDADSSNKNITIEGNWIQEKNGTFNPQEGTVSFGSSSQTNPTFEISGNTTWWNLVCTVPGATIQFSNYDSSNPGTHRIKKKFEVEPSDPDKPILITRLTNNPNPSGTLPPPDSEKSRFWFFTLDDGAELAINHVTVRYSYATTTIPLPEGGDIDALPYYNSDPPPNSCYNYNWVRFVSFVYCFTEDLTGNGKIDRLRLQATVPLNTDIPECFDDIQVVIPGYEVDQSKGDRGYGSVSNHMDCIYVWVKEKDYTDGNICPRVQVVSNTYLVDSATKTYTAGTYDQNGTKIWITSTDTVPPRINYTLTLPLGDSIFVQVSEPLNISTVSSSDVSLAGTWDVITPGNGGGTSEFLLPFNAGPGPSVSDLANGDKQIIISAKDMAAEASLVPFPGYTGNTPPKYPRQYGDYSDYTTSDTGNNVPPNKMPVDTHRITDVLISVPPKSISSEGTFFVWPVWAREDNETIAIANGPDWDGSTVQEFGIVRDFTGKGRLQDRNITLQVIVNQNIFVGPLIFGVNIKEEFRARQEHGPRGLWLPEFYDVPPLSGDPDDYFSNIVPKPYLDTKELSGVPVAGSANLYNYSFTENDYANGSRVEFFFKPDNNNVPDNPLYTGRLDMAAGASIPSDWYRRIKPFIFDIQDITQQRSNATILHNVIDPTKGQKTYLHYKLTKSGRVTVQVFTMDGTLVQVLYRGNRNAGEYIESWDGKNQGGRSVARGLYFIRIVGPDIDEIRKVMVIKE